MNGSRIGLSRGTFGALALSAVVAVVAPAAAMAVAAAVATPTFGSGSPAAGSRVNSTTASISFSSSTSGATFYCSLDGATASTCTSPRSLTSLSEGSHTFAVYGARSSYANSSNATLTWTVDTTAPAAPTLSGAPTARTNQSTANISFTGETGATFTCSVDGGSYSACTSPKALTGLADGDHSLAVKQTDVAGNTGNASTASWTVDTVAPTAVSEFTGDAGQVLRNSTAAVVNFRLTESAANLSSIECRVDSGTWAACPSSSGGYVEVDLSDLAEGSHTLSVRLTDRAGNAGAVGTSPAWTNDLRNFTITTDATSATVTGCGISCPSSAVIPAAWMGKPVTAIGNGAFDSKTGITSISLPSGLKRIGESAFRKTRFTSITLPNGLESIGSSAFARSAVTSLTIPNTVTNIGTYGTFEEMGNLTSITLSSALTSIPESAFNYSTQLTSAAIPWSVTSIGAYAFAGTALTSVGIPSGVTQIAEGAFSDMPNLTSVGMGRVTSIGSYAFGNSSSLATISPLFGGAGGLTSVGDYAFLNTAIRSLTIPDSVTSLGYSAFNGMTQLTSITLPSGLTTIPDGLLGGTSSLTGVTIPSGVTSIGNSAFQGSGITGVTLPSGLTAINPGTFHGSSIRSIVIPNGVTTIGEQAFSGATSLTSVSFPSTLQTVGDSAFDGDSSITSITLPVGVKSVGWYAFRSLTALTSLTLPNTLETISGGAIMNCPKLESLTIPSSVSSIGDDAFGGAGVNSPEFSVRFEGNAPTMGDDPFYLVRSGTKAILASPTLTGYGYNGDVFHGLIVTGGINPPDRTPPTTPGSFTGVPSSMTKLTGATIGFTLGEPGGTVECRVDSGTWGSCTDVTGTSGSLSVSGLADGSHTVSVRQTDAAGNVSTAGTTSSWTVDATAPSTPASFTGVPASQTKLTGATIGFTLGESGGTVECRVDSGTWGSCTDVTGTSGSLSVSGLADGSHTVSVRQTDAAGNVSTPGTTSGWTVDTVAPSKPGSFTGVPASLTKLTGATIGFTLGESGGTVECRLDAGEWGSCSGVTGTTGSLSLSGVGDGVHRVSARQTDPAGNVSDIGYSDAWRVDTTAPAAPTLSAPSGSTTATGAALTFSGESEASLECSVDGGGWSACSSPVTVSGLSVGSHSFSVRATDAAGNTGTAATATWTVTPPPAPVIAPAILTPAPGVKTVYKNGDRWAIKVGLLFSTGGDTRSSAQFLTVQVAADSAGRPVATKPSDTLAPPTTASYVNGIVAWDASGEVLRQSLDRPTWVRVGNKAGKWSGWAKLTP